MDRAAPTSGGKPGQLSTRLLIVARAVLGGGIGAVSWGMLPSPKLCEMPLLVARVVAAIGDAFGVRPSSGGFALVEHVWHLAELETEAFQVRIARLATEAVPWLPDFDGHRLAVERGYIARPLAAGVRAFARGRAATVRALGRLHGPAWLRGGIQDQVGYVTLAEHPERIVGHDKSHAAELGALVAELRPGHAVIDELHRWCAAIADAPASPCHSSVAARPRTTAALPLARIERAIAASVVAGDASTAALGRRLGLSIRTLQRRLADHGLTVQCLAEQSLRAWALVRLRAGGDWRDAAIELGYSDPRAFARAFKRWTHVTPQVFQRAPAMGQRGCA
jgi:AraC-like DNA-binding protein